MDDGFGIMVVSGCRPYVTEPVDVVLVVTGRVLVYVVVDRCMLCKVLCFVCIVFVLWMCEYECVV